MPYVNESNHAAMLYEQTKASDYETEVRAIAAKIEAGEATNYEALRLGAIADFLSSVANIRLS